MNFNKFWKASGLLAAFVIPYTAYSLKSRQGDAWVWGSGGNGQLGLGQPTNISLPQNLKNHRFIQISAGKGMSAGITADGKLYTWGKNIDGHLGHSPPNANVLLPRMVTAVQKIIDKIVQVSSGYSYICAVTQAGDAYIWGTNYVSRSFRKIGTSETARQTPTDVKPIKIEVAHVKQVSCAGEYITLVDKDGKVFVYDTSKTHATQKKDQNIVKININDKIKKVQSGLNHSIALTQDGKVYVWGNNNFGQLGTGSLDSVKQPRLLDALSYETVTDISCGQNFSGALTQTGDVYTWGFGHEGQLGHGDTADQQLPRKIQINQKMQKINCGGAHTALLTLQGKLYMMGRGLEGQLGRSFNDQGNKRSSIHKKPVQQLPADKKVSQVSCGGTHTIVLLQNIV